jgi:hypothetical protein
VLFRSDVAGWNKGVAGWGIDLKVLMVAIVVETMHSY